MFGYIPSWAEDYKFIVCAKYNLDTYDLYGVGDTQGEVNRMVKDIHDDNGEAIIIYKEKKGR